MNIIASYIYDINTDIINPIPLFSTIKTDKVVNPDVVNLDKINPISLTINLDKVLLKILFTNFISKTENKNISKTENKNIIKSKYVFFNSVITNPFIDMEGKANFIYIFGKIQKLCFALNRLIYIHNFNKRAKLQINTDLYLNPIVENSNNIIAIIQNNNKYLFSLK